MGSSSGNAKIFIEAELLDNFKQIASKFKTGMDKVDTNVKIGVDTEEMAETIKQSLNMITRMLGDKNGFIQYLDLSDVMPQLIGALQSGASDLEKNNILVSFIESFKAFDDYTKLFEGDTKTIASGIYNLNDSLGASGVPKYLEDLKNVMGFVNDLKLSTKDKQSVFRSLTDSLGVGVSQDNIVDALALKEIDADFKDVDKFALSAKEARTRLFEELKTWDTLSEGGKYKNKTTANIKGYISRIESLSGKEFTQYLQDKIDDMEASNSSREQAKELLGLYRKEGGWGEFYNKLISSNEQSPKIAKDSLSRMKNITDRVVEMTEKQMEARKKILKNSPSLTTSQLTKGWDADNSLVYSGEAEVVQETSEEADVRKQIADKIAQEVESLREKISLLKKIAELQDKAIATGVESSPEQYEMEALSDAINQVTEKIYEKNSAFQQEQGIVSSVVKSEIADLQDLKNKLQEIADFDNEENKTERISNTKKKVEKKVTTKKKEDYVDAEEIRKKSVLGTSDKNEKQDQIKEKPKLPTIKNKNLPSIKGSQDTRTEIEKEAQAIKDIDEHLNSVTEGITKFGEANSNITAKVGATAEALKKEASALSKMAKTFQQFDDSKIVQQARKENLAEQKNVLEEKLEPSQQTVKDFQDSFSITLFGKDEKKKATDQLRAFYKEVQSYQISPSEEDSRDVFAQARKEYKLWQAYKEAQKQNVSQKTLDTYNPEKLGINSIRNADNVKQLNDELDRRKSVYTNYLQEIERIEKEIDQIENTPSKNQLKDSKDKQKKYEEAIILIKEYIEAQKELEKAQNATAEEPSEMRFSAEQLEGMLQVFNEIGTSLQKIQIALGTLDDNSDVPSIIQSVTEMAKVFKDLGLLIDDINNKRIKLGTPSTPDQQLLGEMGAEDFRNSLTEMFDESIQKIKDFKTNVDMSETVQNFKKQISEMEKAIKSLEKELDKEKKGREKDKAQAKLKEEKVKEKARQDAFKKQQEQEEKRKKEEEALLKKQQEEEQQRLKEQQIQAEKIAKEEAAMKLKIQQDRAKVLEQGRIFQIDEQKKQTAQTTAQTKKNTYVNLNETRTTEQNKAFNELLQAQEYQRKIVQENQRKVFEQGRALQAEQQQERIQQQKQEAEQIKKNGQLELEQARAIEQVKAVQAQQPKKQIEQQAIKEDIVSIKKKAWEEAQKYNIEIPFQVDWGASEEKQQQIFSLEESSAAMKRVEEFEKIYAKIKKTKDFLRGGSSVESFLLKYEDIPLTKSTDKLIDNMSKLETVKEKLESSFDDKGKLIGDPLEVQYLLEQYQQLIEENNKLQEAIKAPSSEENIALQLVKDTNKAIIETQKLKSAIESTYSKLISSADYINIDLNLDKALKPLSNISSPTETMQKLIDTAEKIRTIKAQLSNSFDSNNNLIGDPQQVEELFKKFKKLTTQFKELKAAMNLSDSEESVTSKTNKELQKINQAFNNKQYDLFEKKNRLVAKKYGSFENIEGISSLVSIEDVEENLQEQQKQVKELIGLLGEYRQVVEKLKTEKDSEIVDLDKLQKANEEVKSLEGKITTLSNSIKTGGIANVTTKQIDTLAGKFEVLLEKNPQFNDDIKNKIQEYINVLTSGATVSKTAYDSMSADLTKFSNQTKTYGNIWDLMTMKIKEGVAYIATKFSFYEILQQFRQGVQIIHQFDDALTEMQKVSDETLTSLQRYQKTTFDMANAIGANALQIQNSTADFMRLGETLNQAAESAKVANVLMNVSEFQSIDEATESLIAMGAAYDDLTKMNIIDKLNEVGNNYAISTSEAATALQASASALTTAGNDMDEALALVTAGNAVVQDATKVGTGMRTIALRLTGTESAKEQLEEMGEETENVITTQSKLRDVIKEATAVESNEFKGFDILDDNGNYKSTYEIMLGIAEVYDEIVETDKKLGRNNVNLLLENVAGKVRANIAASVFQNPELLKDAYKSSQEANGSAMKENEKYLDSISGHLAQLTNAWQKMWANAANRDALNFFIDLGTAFINFIDKVGLLPSSLGAIVAYIEIIRTGATGGKGGFITALLRDLAALDTSSKIQTENELTNAQATMVNTGAIKAETEVIEENTKAKAENTLVDTTDNVGDVAGAIASGADAMQDASKETGVLTKKTNLLSGAWGGLVATLGTTGAVISVVSALAVVLGLVGKAMYDADKAEKASTAKEITQSLKQRQETLSEQIDSYNKLKEKLNSGDLSEQETIDTKQQILDIQKSIVEEYGSQANGLDLVNGKLEHQVELLGQINQKNAEQEYYRGYEGFQIAKKEYEKNRSYNIQLAGTSDAKLNKAIADELYSSGLQITNAGMGTFNATANGSAIENIKVLQKARDNLEALKSDYKDPHLLEGINKQISNIEKQIGEAYEIIDEYEETALQGMALDLAVNDKSGFEVFKNYQSSVSDLESAYLTGTSEEINNARKAFDEASIAKNKFFSTSGNEKLLTLFNSIDDSLVKTKNQFQDETELLKEGLDVPLYNPQITQERLAQYKKAKALSDKAYGELGDWQKKGNIDIKNTPIVFWDEKEREKQAEALKSWGLEVKKNDKMTAAAVSSKRNNIEFSAIMTFKDEKGHVRYLTQESYNKYLRGIINKAGENATPQDYFNLDAEGLVVDGHKVSNIFAGVGASISDTGLSLEGFSDKLASAIGDVLRPFGDFKKEWEAAEEAGMTFYEYMEDQEKQIDAVTKATQKYSKKQLMQIKYAQKLAGLDPDRIDIESALIGNTSASNKYYNALRNLINAMDWESLSAEEVADRLVASGIALGDSGDIADNSAQSFQRFSSIIEDASNNINTLNTALSESFTGKGIGNDTLKLFQDSFGEDAIGVLEKTANGYHLNAQNAHLLREQQTALVKTNFASELYNQSKALEELQRGYIKAKNEGKDTTGYVQQRQAIQDNINALYDNIMAYQNANSAYQTWIANQNSEGDREMYNSVYSGYDTIKDEFERGWAGEKTRSWLDLVLNDEDEEDFDVWTAKASELKDRFDDITKDIEGTGGFSIGDFFTVDDQGKSTSEGIWNFFEAIENKQDEVLEEGQKKFVDLANEEFDFTENGDWKIAEMLGMDVESVQAILRAATEAGFEIHLDQPLYSLERIAEKAEVAKESLEGFLGGQLKTNLDFSTVEEADKAMAELVEYRDSMANDTSIEPNVKAEQLQNLADIMEYIAVKRRELVENNLIEFKVDNTELDKADDKITEIRNALSSYSKKKGNVSINDMFSIDPIRLGDVDYLNQLYQQIAEVRFSPDVDTAQIDYLNELLIAIQEKIDLLNGVPVSGGLTIDQYMAAEQAVNDINTKLQYASEHSNLQINWDADSEFIETLNTLANLPPEVKSQFGMEPDATGAELLELAKKGELDLKLKTSGGVETPKSTTVDTYETIHKNEEVTFGVTTIGTEPAQELMQGLSSYDGQSFDAYLQAHTEEAQQNIEQANQEKKEFEDSNPESDLKANDQSTPIVNLATGAVNAFDGLSATAYLNLGGDALSDITSFKNKWNSIESKSVTLTTFERKISIANGTAHVQGTAFARGSIVSGNAYAGGKWGLPKNQSALTGELGTEIVVRDGNWFTVGDNGAEFVNLQKGDIVFNHKQSEELLENGYVTSNKGRGHLVGFANGTAYSRGSSSGAIRPSKKSTGMGGSSRSSSSGSSGSGSGGNSGNSGNGGNNSSEKAKETKNTLDEVEILISRIEREISQLDTIIGSTYSTWSRRNKAIISNLKKVSTEIVDQEKAFNVYVKKAKSVDLSSSWKRKIRDGAFKIEDVKDSDLWDKINEYKQWWDKALACKDAIVDLREKEGELYKQRFDNEQSYYEEVISNTQHSLDLIEAYNDQLSEAGRLGSVTNVTNQIALEKKRLTQLKNEYNSLIKQRDNAVKSGKIKKGSEAWYEMQQAIYEVGESIAEANTNLITFANNINEINFDRWDKIHDAIGGVTNELEFLYDLLNPDEMFDEKGSITNQGTTAFALLAHEYDTYFKEVQRYQQEINETERLLSKKENKYNQTLVDKLKELKEAQQDAASSAQKTKDSMVDLTEDGIKKQIDYVKKLIEDYEELLESQKDQIDYAKKVADQQNEINKLEKQYKAIQNDTSEEGATKRQQLRDQIKEKREALQETQEDRRISETKDMLSQFEETFEEFLENKLKNIEGIVREVINATNENKNVIRNTINDVASSYGYTISDTLSTAINTMSKNLVSYFDGGFENPHVTSIAQGVDAIVKYFTSAQKDSEQEAKNRAMAEKVKKTGTHIQTYTDANGKTKTGYFKDDGSLYENYTGWAAKDGKTYRFNKGNLMSGNQWVTADGKKYHLDSNGARATNTWREINGKKYYFDSSGVMKTGLQTINNKKFYFNKDGVLQTGLQTISGKKYYFDKNGVMSTNTWRGVGDDLYYFDSSGVAKTGMQTINNKKFYFNKNGVAQKGFQTIDGSKYYFDKNGVMSVDTWRGIGEDLYYFDKTGKAISGWFKDSKGNWRFFSPKTNKMVKAHWIHNGQITDKPVKGDYYVNNQGYRVLDGKRKTTLGYKTFDKNGKWKGYKTGTKGVKSTDLYWTNEGKKPEAIIRKSDGAILTPLSKGDSVIPNSAMKNMYQALTDPEKYLKQYTTTPDIKVVQSKVKDTSSSPTINMQFIANGVQDASTFANELMNNKKLEKWIQEVTLGQANGNNSFRKYNYAIR